ncbi:hypothetical protein MOD25_05465 [Bacillus haynesii]|uniref:hypothetical protein n=1 Tax=Bacillus haynesii TaxID=1925021 RepID=UPI00228001B0|nr:hypothetical protein [Bacillus haynesii]MCY8549349.1 hypothetical protein [Bacillus haynesii]
MLKFAEKVRLISGNYIGYIVEKDNKNPGHYWVLLEEFNDVTSCYTGELTSLGYDKSYDRFVNDYLINKKQNEDKRILKSKSIVSFKDKMGNSHTVYVAETIDSVGYGYILKKNLKINYRRKTITPTSNYTIRIDSNKVKGIKIIKENVDEEEVKEYLSK